MVEVLEKLKKYGTHQTDINDKIQLNTDVLYLRSKKIKIRSARVLYLQLI